MSEDFRAKDWREALSRWDAGKTVFTVQMGGLGPGYDHAINLCVFDLLRHAKRHGCRTKEGRKFPECWYKVTYKASPEFGGLSGAQAGAAMNLAANYISPGYREVLDMPDIRRERIVQDSKGKP